MTGHGWFKVYRQIFDDPDFRGHVFSDREAWIYLISQASHKDHKSGDIMLRRGEVLTSLNRLATTFRWTKSKVRYWLKKLEKSGKISAPPNSIASARGATHLSICKYETYQGLRTDNSTASAPPSYNKNGLNKNGNTIEQLCQVGDQLDLSADQLSAKEKGKAEKAKIDKDVQDIFDLYIRVSGRDKLRYKFTPARRQKVRARYLEFKKDGKDGRKWCSFAIQGCLKNKFNQGENDRDTKYIDIAKHIFNSYEQAEARAEDYIGKNPEVLA